MDFNEQYGVVKELPRFEPTGLGATIFSDRYAEKGETFEEASMRVARHVAAAEESGNVDEFANRFYEQLASNRFCPGGRIWYGAGKDKAQLLNCYVLNTNGESDRDSREGWGRLTSDVIVISGLMGGIGINMNGIRPRGSEIKGTGGFATGAVSLMQLIDGVGDVIQGGGGRRMALMLSLDLDHPDIEEFLHSKIDKHALNNANISIVLPKDFAITDFVERVKNDEQIELRFNGKATGKTIGARWIWECVVNNSWLNGEPGFLNGNYANEQNNIWYHRELETTNPCGEIWLENYGACCLGALVLPRFVENGEINWVALTESIKLGVRFLDNVLTVNHYPIKEIEENCKTVRRLGLGIMGLHTMLLELGLPYDSEKSFEVAEAVQTFIKEIAYEESCELAAEKGAFPAYDPRFLESGFMKKQDDWLHEKISRNGIRNCALLTIAPTGTTSLFSNVSSACEPSAPPVYWRNFNRLDDNNMLQKNRELVVEESFFKYPELAQSAIDIPVENHFRMQAVLQDHIDNAVSKTINLDQSFPQDEFGDIWLKYLPRLKGSTVYRYGSRDFEPIQVVPRDQWDALISEHKGEEFGRITEEEFLEAACPGGVCEVKAHRS